MIVIAERINATRKPVAAAIAGEDAAAIAEIARRQDEAGADVIDVNGGDPVAEKELANILWLIEAVRTATEKPLAIDTASPEAMKQGLAAAGPGSLLNSISLEAGRTEPMLDVAAGHDGPVVALLMADAGPPTGVDDRVERAGQLIEKLTAAGKTHEQIIIDPCVLPISSDVSAGPAFLRAVGAIREAWPEVHIGGGVSNVSFGLPKRPLVNAAFLIQAVGAGLDAAILDPLAPGLMASVLAAEAVAGRDEFCMNYVTAEREGKLA